MKTTQLQRLGEFVNSLEADRLARMTIEARRRLAHESIAAAMDGRALLWTKGYRPRRIAA